MSDPQEATGFLSTSTENSITVNSITVKGQSKADSGTSGDFAARTDITVSIEGTSMSETGKLPITFTELQANKEYTIKVVIPDVMGDIVLKKKVRTTEGSVKDVTAPDLSGFNTSNTYYATFDSAAGTIGANISTIDDSLVDGRKIALNAPTGWYDYDNKKWANIVTMNEDGEAAYFTWVPRYEYKINEELNSIDIVYITANRTEPDEGYQIPDAFTFDGKALSGLWVGKYEMTDVAIPTGFNTQSIDGGFKITGIVYNNSCTRSGMPSSGEMVIKQNGVTKKTLIASVNGKVDGLAAGVYTVEWKLELAYTKPGGTKNYKTITKEIAVRSSIKPEEPDLSGFNNDKTYAYYVEFGEDLNSLDDMKVGDRITFTDGKANNIPTNWYDYDNKKWANIVVSDTPIDKGSRVNSLSAIKNLTVWVWIPRYEYRIDGSVSVVFLPKGDTSADSGYAIPDAFKFDNKDLSGIWVGKYEIEQQLSGG